MDSNLKELLRNSAWLVAAVKATGLVEEGTEEQDLELSDAVSATEESIARYLTKGTDKCNMS